MQEGLRGGGAAEIGSCQIVGFHELFGVGREKKKAKLEHIPPPRSLKRHHDTVNQARATAAQPPTDPGDGWTWNERLGWIGPDGKPADPRRRG